MAADVGASAGGARCSFISLEVDQQFMAIKEANPLLEIIRVVIPSDHQERIPEQPTREPAPERTESKRTITLVL